MNLPGTKHLTIYTSAANLRPSPGRSQIISMQMQFPAKVMLSSVQSWSSLENLTTFFEHLNYGKHLTSHRATKKGIYECLFMDKFIFLLSLAFRDIFHMFDMRGGGFIRSEDMNEALQLVDIKLTEEELAELFEGMDVDGKTNSSMY